MAETLHHQEVEQFTLKNREKKSTRKRGKVVCRLRGHTGNHIGSIGMHQVEG